MVIKPSVVEGFENAVVIAQWAQHQGKMTVVSTAFENGLGLSAYIQFSCNLELHNADICEVMNKEAAVPVTHGLETYHYSNLYRQMINEGISQSILVSRESGAGKPESMKMLMQYLAHLGRRAAAEGQTMEHQVVESNHVLEAFGNAKTLRNNNSRNWNKSLKTTCKEFIMFVGKLVVDSMLSFVTKLGARAEVPI